MKAKKKPIIIDYWECELEHARFINEWSTKERPINITITEDKDIIVEITTLEGVMTATNKDVIIKGIDSEVYPCKKDIFEKTYEKI